MGTTTSTKGTEGVPTNGLGRVGNFCTNTILGARVYRMPPTKAERTGKFVYLCANDKPPNAPKGHGKQCG
jgi:hypothetical protein